MQKVSYNSSKKYETFYNGAVQYTSLYRLPNLYGTVEDIEFFLENEKISLTVTKTGDVVFCDEGGRVIVEATVEPKTRKNVHEDAFLRVQDGKAYIYFSIMDYEDNYPNCDGECDRWTSVTVGYDCLAFDISTGDLQIFKVDKLKFAEQICKLHRRE